VRIDQGIKMFTLKKFSRFSKLPMTNKHSWLFQKMPTNQLFSYLPSSQEEKKE
jgi:hypothetical protein